MPTVEQQQDEIKISHVWSKRTDIRIGKKYGLNLDVTVSLGEFSFCRRCLPSEAFPKVDTSDLPYIDKAKSFGRFSDSRGTCECSKNQVKVVESVVFCFYLPAKKPSKIVSESVAQRMIAREAPENEGKKYGDLISLEEILRQRIISALETSDQESQKDDIAKQASRLVEWLTKEANEKARKTVSFQERLKALKAELEAEQKKSLQHFIQNKLQDACADSEEEWHPRAIELAVEKAEKNLPRAISGPFGRSHSTAVKSEDV